jgi:hypothetical protein
MVSLNSALESDMDGNERSEQVAARTMRNPKFCGPSKTSVFVNQIIGFYLP